ncbi:DNA-3-methyladenine glycosylase [Falsarthrobacter nasiphocae]|uniref:Putative 3-methyladenine DNA glycosylase n=1 Tax=Falsarthrobacter nasiphocae TaxID=189863 RepID=A0AAE3YG35_9MICC|nr:DNA-3-methyladenine glycosylase [Falsarthrobacter nasiphocae]
MLARGPVAVVITETEGYLGDADPASHAWKGPTKRNAVMFGPPGRLYTYAMHGHTCCNVVCSAEGEARAVLVRAGRVILGVEEATARRGDVPEHRLARGPGCLTRALGVTMANSGARLLEASSEVRLLFPETTTALPILAGPRVGVPRAENEPLRFMLDGDASVSAFRPGRGVKPTLKPVPLGELSGPPHRLDGVFDRPDRQEEAP